MSTAESDVCERSAEYELGVQLGSWEHQFIQLGKDYKFSIVSRNHKKIYLLILNVYYLILQEL